MAELRVRCLEPEQVMAQNVSGLVYLLFGFFPISNNPKNCKIRCLNEARLGMCLVPVGYSLDMIAVMNFTIPADGSLFEIPDSWLEQAGVVEVFTPEKRRYICAKIPEQGVLFVPLKVIAPPRKTPDVVRLDQAKAVSLLRAMCSGEPLPPIEVNQLTPRDYFSYRVFDGFHRYHVAIALGISTMPVICKPVFDMAYSPTV